MNYADYLDAGFKIFGIHGATDGVCGCGDPECKALYKHPVISGWQNVPDWSDEQLETFELMGHFKTGFGVLCAGWLIIDVDARNGGVTSFDKLLEAVPEIAGASFCVLTGSGGGSKHIYFSAPPGAAMAQSHRDYPGIDFKTSGYVIGAGSLHASGAVYEAVSGHPCDITPAPDALIQLLKKPDTYRASSSGGQIDITAAGVVELLSYISPDCAYDRWIKVGMAVHHVTCGDGQNIWDDWSSTGKDYAGAESIARHWHSFGKSAQPAGIGTLLCYAREGGYIEPVTFEFPAGDSVPAGLDTSAIDLMRPPGFVGELAQWINDQCLYPRESLAVGAALCAVGSIAGMRHYDALDDMTPNMIAFCVAGSGTGKEAIQQAYLKIMRAAGVASAVHGAFKSEQELMRNFVRNQAAFYMIDELGTVLSKLVNASKRGGAAYLEGIIGLIMSVYSKANGFLPVTGDLKESIKADMLKELGVIRAQIDKLSGDSSGDARAAILGREEQRIESSIKNIDNGLENPFLSVIGYTTPVTFDGLMDFEQATNGFLARAVTFKDLETNPRRKDGFEKRPMPDQMAFQLSAMYSPGVFDLQQVGARVEFVGKKTPIPTDSAGRAMLDQVYEAFHAMAEEQKDATGLEAIPRRGYEIAAKVSLILAIPEGVRTAEHVLWAYALAKRDCEEKIKLAYSTDAQTNPETETNGHAAKILSLISTDHGETMGVICNRLRSIPKERVRQIVDQLILAGEIIADEKPHKIKKTPVVRYFAAK